MTSYTSIFGGNAVRPSDQSLGTVTLTAETTLVWPTDGGTPSTSAIMEITANTLNTEPGTPTPWVLKLPDARRASPGETITFRGLGTYDFSIADNAGNDITTISPGMILTFYLSDNSTAAGTWSFWQAGAGYSLVDANALAGSGLSSYNGTLRVNCLNTKHTSTATFADDARGSIATWTGGTGTLNCPDPANVGDGWYMIFKNAGSGTLTIDSTSTSATFDGLSSISLLTNEGATVVCDGTNFTYVKHGSGSPASTLSYLSISVAGSGTYTLSAAEYANGALNFTGALTGNRTIVVPTAVKSYIISNNTTGSYTLTVKTAAGSGVAVTQTKTQTLYCDGTNVYAAVTDFGSGLSIPIVVSSGGTGATTAPGALTNLGGTAVGTSVFTAADAATARSAISAASLTANTYSGAQTLNIGTNVTPGASWTGHFTINGSGYSGGISLDATGMWVGHTSGTRDLILATDETARVRINGTGNVGLGVAPSTNVNLSIGKDIAGAASAYGAYVNSGIDGNTVSASAYGYYTNLYTKDIGTPWSLGGIYHFLAGQGTFLGSATVTSQVGFYSQSNLISATNNYGFYAANTAATAGTAHGFYSAINISTGGGTTWAFNGAGTAWSRFAAPVIQEDVPWVNAPAPTSKTTTVTLTAAELKNQIIVTGQVANINVTFPTGTAIDTGFSGIPTTTNIGFDVHVINTGLGGTTTMVANTGVTIVGSADINNFESGHFRLRRTAANTYVAYRVA